MFSRFFKFMSGKNFSNCSLCIEYQYVRILFIILLRVRTGRIDVHVKRIAYLPFDKRANTIPESRSLGRMERLREVVALQTIQNQYDM